MPYTVIDPSTAASAPATTAGAPLTSVGETLSDFRDELMAELMQRNDVDEFRLNGWINKGYRNLSQSIDLQELWGSVAFALVADQPFYLVPESLSWIKLFCISDSTDYTNDGGIELDLIDIATYRTLPDTSAIIGTAGGNTSWLIPSSYFRYGRVLVVYPTPQVVYTAPMDFRVRPLDMEADDDSPILPSEWHEAILHSARVRAFRSLKMYKEAAGAQNDLVVTVRSLVNTDGEEKDAMNMVMQPVTARSQLYRGRP